MHRASLTALSSLIVFSFAGVVSVLADDRAPRPGPWQAPHAEAGATRPVARAGPARASQHAAGQTAVGAAAEAAPAAVAEVPETALILPGALPSLGPLPGDDDDGSAAMRDALQLIGAVEARVTAIVLGLEEARRRGTPLDPSGASFGGLAGMDDLAQAATGITERLTKAERQAIEEVARRRLQPWIERMMGAMRNGPANDDDVGVDVDVDLQLAEPQIETNGTELPESPRYEAPDYGDPVYREPIEVPAVYHDIDP